jgi:transposase InsO family protein
MKTYLRAKQRYYWPRMRADIGRYVRSCEVCQKNKPDNKKPTGLMGKWRQANQPWKMISADLIGPLPRSSRGFKYILVVVDTFSKFCLLYPLRSATSAAVARHLEDDVYMMFGVPQYVICDNGPEFDGKAVRKLAEKYNVRMLYNAKYHPQSNPTERTNRTIGTMLRSYVKDNQRAWDQTIPQIGFALRTAVNDTTGFTPAYLNFGRELLMKGQDNPAVDRDLQPPSAEEIGQRVKKLENLQDICKDVKMRLEAAYNANEKRYNLRHREMEFQVGAKVLKRNFVQSDKAKFFSSKLASRFVGPYEVTKKISPAIYQLRDEMGQDVGRWHVSDLRPFLQRQH